MFGRGSRYERVADAVHVDAAGREIAYKRLRLIPSPRGVQAHLVVEGDRLDLLAFRYLGDPEQFWRLCDASRVLHPGELTAHPGRRVLIPLLQE
jgi:hypothetical protein